LDIIKEKYNRNLSLEDICQEVSVSKNYFCYLFKRETGMSLWNYLTVVRLQHARELLEKTDLRSYEIAFQVGYENPSYFSTLFKKYEHMSPNEYREQNRNISK
ncbi:MAG: helix-turn-helix domain-containing protein, partial [Lachnospiraceae bacterium]